MAWGGSPWSLSDLCCSTLFLKHPAPLGFMLTGYSSPRDYRSTSLSATPHSLRTPPCPSTALGHTDIPANALSSLFLGFLVTNAPSSVLPPTARAQAVRSLSSSLCLRGSLVPDTPTPRHPAGTVLKLIDWLLTSHDPSPP